MKRSVKMIIAGSVLFAGGIVFGVGGTIVSMIGAFDTMAVSGVDDSEMLAEELSNALITTAIGIPVSLAGFSLLVGGSICYFTGKNKENVSEQPV